MCIEISNIKCSSICSGTFTIRLKVCFVGDVTLSPNVAPRAKRSKDKFRVQEYSVKHVLKNDCWSEPIIRIGGHTVCIATLCREWSTAEQM